LPLSQDKFAALRGASEYCGRFVTWSQYQKALEVTRRREQLELLSSLGLRGCEPATFDKFRQTINDGPAVLAVLGHCRDSAEIEFADGFKSLQEVVAVIPRDFGGVLDVSVCNPLRFVEMAKKRAEHAVIRTAETPLDGRQWLLFYATLFINIGRLGSYGVALLQTIDDFMSAKKKWTPLSDGATKW
jgi:hypothetical protein